MDYERVLDAVEELYHQPNVARLKPDELRRRAEGFGTRTKWGNYNFVSTVKNRSAGLTVYVGGPRVLQHRLNPRQKEIFDRVPQTIDLVHRYLKRAPFVCVERTMGRNDEFIPHCTLFVSVHRKEMIRLAYMVSQTLFDPREGPGPDLKLVYIPEWQEKDRQILVFPEVGVTYVLGSDYYGEAKKGFLRMAMWHAKQKGMLGLHAGAKVLRAQGRDGRIRRYGMLIFGLTATGKTTHTCHTHGLTAEGEGIEILQDDVIILKKDGSVLGTEKGFYLKTEGVNPRTQPIIYNAATKPDTIFENVMVDHRGNVDFDDETLTGNGRGIMQRKDLAPYITETINLPSIDELDGLILLFVTRRNTVVPIVSQLSLEQAAAAFMLGESIESTGGDPRRVGESVREVGTNPFLIGNEAEEGNWLYEFLKKHSEKAQCYLLNTGGVGEIVGRREDGSKVVKQKVVRPEIPETASVIRGIARDSIEWRKDPYFNTLVPKGVEGVDMGKFDLSKYYSRQQVEAYFNGLKDERMAWLKKFDGLNSAIIDAVK